MAQGTTDSAADLMTQAEVARELGVKVQAVRGWIADGRLPAVHLGTRLIRIRRGDLHLMMSPVPTTPAA